LGIPFSSILCTCPNQRNLCSIIVSVMVGCCRYHSEFRSGSLVFKSKFGGLLG
jgi:hypothetical protein